MLRLVLTRLTKQLNGLASSPTELALECDWHVDGTRGLEIYQFDRESRDGPYTMLHIVATVRRQNPARGHRGPGQVIAPQAASEHKKAIQSLFNSEVVSVETRVFGPAAIELQRDLDNLFKHREKYYSPAPDVGD